MLHRSCYPLRYLYSIMVLIPISLSHRKPLLNNINNRRPFLNNQRRAFQQRRRFLNNLNNRRAAGLGGGLGFANNNNNNNDGPPLHKQPGPPYPGPNPRAPNKPLDPTIIHPSNQHMVYQKPAGGISMIGEGT